MINYPIHIKRSPTTAAEEKASTKVSAADRGMALEHDLNRSNEWYLQQDKAVIYKKPTPVTIVKVDYPARRCMPRRSARTRGWCPPPTRS